MSLARFRLLRPARDALGRRLHLLIDRRIQAQIERELPALEIRLARRSSPDPHVVGPPERLTIGNGADVAAALLDTRSGRILVGPYVVVSEGATILTGSLDVERRGAARAASLPATGGDVVIESGVWIAARAIVLGPCRIGADAVVAAGAVVTGDVPAATVVAGVPARVVRRLPAMTHGLPPAVEVETDVGRLYVADDGDADAGVDRELLRASLRPGMTVVDVGAGVGYATLVSGGEVGSDGTVIAIEHRRDRAWLLRANVMRHRCSQGANVAIVTPSDAATLDEIAELPARVDLLRVDAAGSEHVVIGGARNLIERCRPVILTAFRPGEAGTDPRAVLTGYRALGYVVESAGRAQVADDDDAIQSAAGERGTTLLLRPA
jgi:acetyltransferase-like isoleucine patch superfamily enzyme